jgi:hypothetical protein
MLVGFNTSTLHVHNVIPGDRCVKFILLSKEYNFKWVLVAVYGTSQEEHKLDFLAELVRTCKNEELPMLVGGDFNINARWSFMFNSIIESLDFRELVL